MDGYKSRLDVFRHMATERGLPPLPGVSIWDKEVWSTWSRNSPIVQQVYIESLTLFSSPLDLFRLVHQIAEMTLPYDPEPFLLLFRNIENGTLRLGIGDALAKSKPINPCPRMLEIVNDEAIDPIDRQSLYRPIRVHCGKAKAREIMIAQHDPQSMFWLREFSYVAQSGTDIDLLRPGLTSEDAEIRAYAKRKIASAEKRVAKRLGIT